MLRFLLDGVYNLNSFSSTVLERCSIARSYAHGATLKSRTHNVRYFSAGLYVLTKPGSFGFLSFLEVFQDAGGSWLPLFKTISCATTAGHPPPTLPRHRSPATEGLVEG